MVTHMKTPIDIADDLLLRAKREAEASRTTLRSLIEEGLRPVLERLCVQARLAGGKVHDARIAAMCLNHGVAEPWTADRDFSAFPGLKTRNPLIAT